MIKILKHCRVHFHELEKRNCDFLLLYVQRMEEPFVLCVGDGFDFRGPNHYDNALITGWV